MIKLKEAVIVEGRYDKIKLSRLIDAAIITTNGYRVFKDKAALAMIRNIGLKNGIIILTDSDAAGFRIRRYLQGAIPGDRIKHVYLPQIRGKEARKDKPSAEGLLGVEGVDDDVLLEAFKKAGVRPCGEEDTGPKGAEITKTDFVELKLSGAADSGERRAAILGRLDMPVYLSAKAIIDLLNATMTRDEFFDLCSELFDLKS